MTTTIKQTLRDSKVARWTALIIVSFTMMWGYFLTDAMSPLMDMLGISVEQGGMGWSANDFGNFNWAYMWFNVFLFMLIFGGIILDKIGVRLTGIVSCLFMVIGAGIKYYAVEYIQPGGEAIFMGLNQQVLTACLGYAIFAVGTENCGITVTKVIAKWFAGHEMALAMGIQVAVARLGTALALAVGPVLAKNFEVSTPLLLALVLLIVGLLSYIVFCVMDSRLDQQEDTSSVVGTDDETFKMGDLTLILRSKGFWLIALLCLCFYSAVFPFLKYATSLMINKYQVDPALAGTLPAILPFGNLLMTPIFGGIYDRYGKGATIMVIGSVLLIVVHVLFAMPILNYWWFAAIIMVVLGIAFSLVPSAMWPSVPKIIPLRLLGSAYALIFWVQNIGLGGVPLLIGYILSEYCITGTVVRDGNAVAQYDYTLPMLIFAFFGVIALFLAIWLKIEDRKKGYGLEKPNM
ncbi:MAG: MFS transporter [Paraprevotella sp.]|nr:MFS transporter [Paraprevotella sp.]